MIWLAILLTCFPGQACTVQAVGLEATWGDCVGIVAAFENAMDDATYLRGLCLEVPADWATR